MLKRPPERVSFRGREEIIDLPNLIEIQIKSFQQFLQADRLPHERENIGLEEVFQEIFPIKSYDEKTGIITWNVQYKPGKLKVIAFKSGQEAATDEIMTTSIPVKLKAEVVEATDDELVTQIIVKVVDENNHHVVLADNEITCVVTGGTLLGMENASVDVSENYLDNKHRCRNGRLLIYIKKNTKNNPATLTISSPLMDFLVVNLQ